MKIHVNRQEMLAAAQDAEKIVPFLTPLETQKCVFLSAENEMLTIAATSSEVALEHRIKATVEEEGCAVIEARLLCGMLRLLEDEAISISREGYVLTVSGQTAVYKVAISSEQDYPRAEIPFPEETVPVIGIPAMAKRTVFAVAQEESRPVMKCVHMIFTSDGLNAVSSDSYRIAIAKGDRRSTGAVSFLMPAISLSLLAQLVTNKDQLRVGITGKTVVFTKENFLFSARLIEGSYFDADQLMHRVQSAFIVLTDAERLRSAVQSTCAVRGQQSRFCFIFLGNTLRVTHENEFGRSSVDLDVVPLSGTPAGTYWYTVGKLVECLRAQNGTMMLEVAPNGALLMRTDDLICMQMAIREPGPVVLAAPRIKREIKAKRGISGSDAGGKPMQKESRTKSNAAALSEAA